MAHYTALLQEHKEAQSGLEYYGRLRSETECNYRHICILQQQNLTPGRLAELNRLYAIDAIWRHARTRREAR